MNILLLASVLLPLLGFLLIFFSNGNGNGNGNEHSIAKISLWITRLKGVAVPGLLALWAAGGYRPSPKPGRDWRWPCF